MVTAIMRLHRGLNYVLCEWLQIASAKKPDLNRLKEAIRVVDINAREKDDVMAHIDKSTA